MKYEQALTDNEEEIIKILAETDKRSVNIREKLKNRKSRYTAGDVSFLTGMIPEMVEYFATVHGLLSEGQRLNVSKALFFQAVAISLEELAAYKSSYSWRNSRRTILFKGNR